MFLSSLIDISAYKILLSQFMSAFQGKRLKQSVDALDLPHFVVI